jgi:hypothetical protein
MIAAWMIGVASMCWAAPATMPASRPAAPKRVLFLVDGSGSVGNRLLDIADEVSKAISTMPENTTFAIVIGRDPAPSMMIGGFVRPTEQNRQRAYDFIRNTRAEGISIGLLASVTMASKLQADTVWFLSDGQFDEDELGNAMVKARIKANVTTKFSSHDEKLLHIASVTGGNAINKDGDEIPVKRPEDKKPQTAPTGKSIFK